MRKWFILLLALAMLLPSAHVSAQAEARIATLIIELWPEFDRPEMLVIYYITLAPDTVFPNEVTLRIPANVTDGKPYVVATGDTLDTADDRTAIYRVEPDGDWLQVIIQANGPAIILEYYAPLERDGATRRYTYRWPGTHAVDSAYVRVQQPAGATTLQSNLPLVDLGVDTGQGLRYLGYDAGALAAGQELQVPVRYDNPQNLLSVEALEVQPSPSLDESTSGRVNLQRYLPYILGGLGIALVIGGLVFYFSSGRQPRSRPRRHRRTERPAAVAEEASYCPQCGARAQPGDRFCRACGTRLRRQS